MVLLIKSTVLSEKSLSVISLTVHNMYLLQGHSVVCIEQNTGTVMIR